MRLVTSMHMQIKDKPAAGQEKKFHEQSINVSNLYFQNVYKFMDWNSSVNIFDTS